MSVQSRRFRRFAKAQIDPAWEVSEGQSIIIERKAWHEVRCVALRAQSSIFPCTRVEVAVGYFNVAMTELKYHLGTRSILRRYLLVIHMARAMIKTCVKSHDAFLDFSREYIQFVG